MSLKQIKELLFQGKMEQLVEQVTQLPDKGAAKQFKTYFFDNQKRMQYAAFRDKRLPIGSGLIESAIRRVVNLRLKSAGSFWLLENAEAMLFLRAQLLYGRWEIFQKHWAHQLTQEWNQSEQPKVIAFPQREQRKNTKTNFDTGKSQQHGKPRKKAA